jgi:hypothetical protein
MTRVEVHTGLLLGNPKERDHLEDLGVNGRVIVEYIFKKLFDRGVEWIDLVQEREKMFGCCD